MPYKIGVSSGWWRFDRPGELLGIPMKVGGFGATLGTTFIQVDLETTSEFFEPQLKQRLTRLKKELGMELGLHGEIGELMALESGERRIWEQSHLRLCETVKHAAELGMVFVNIHMSHNPQMWQREAQLKPFGHTYQVVGPDGRPLPELCDKSPAAKAYAVRRIMPGAHGAGSIDAEVQEAKEKELEAQDEKILQERMKQIRESPQYQSMKQQYEIAIAAERSLERKKALQQELEARLAALERTEQDRIWRELYQERYRNLHEDPEVLYDMWRGSRFGRYFLEWGEIGAYHVVAAYMNGTNDPLWRSLCGGSDPTDAYAMKQPGFNAAVAMKYIEGHLTAKTAHNDKHLKGKSILEWLADKKIYLNFEIPEVDQPGQESLLRLYDPRDMYLLLKKLGSPWIKLCIDFEHMISQKMEPEDIIKKAPGDFGKYICLFHLGKPIPYFGTAHAQIPVPSRSMEILYRWLFMLRRKGFVDGWMIYERGGGKNPLEVMQQSVWALRQIAGHLEKDIAPDELPETFYGISASNKDMYARQMTAMREHAWDPLAGLLTIPEETHTFLSRAAVEKGKAEEWKRARFR